MTTFWLGVLLGVDLLGAVRQGCLATYKVDVKGAETLRIIQYKINFPVNVENFASPSGRGLKKVMTPVHGE